MEGEFAPDYRTYRTLTGIELSIARSHGFLLLHLEAREIDESTPQVFECALTEEQASKIAQELLGGAQELQRDDY